MLHRNFDQKLSRLHGITLTSAPDAPVHRLPALHSTMAAQEHQMPPRLKRRLVWLHTNRLVWLHTHRCLPCSPLAQDRRHWRPARPRRARQPHSTRRHAAGRARLLCFSAWGAPAGRSRCIGGGSRRGSAARPHTRSPAAAGGAAPTRPGRPWCRARRLRAVAPNWAKRGGARAARG